jgi:hypothetical protein
MSSLLSTLILVLGFIKPLLIATFCNPRRIKIMCMRKSQFILFRVGGLQFFNFFSGFVAYYYGRLLCSFDCSHSYCMYIHECKKVSDKVTVTLSRAEHLLRANFIDS